MPGLQGHEGRHLGSLKGQERFVEWLQLGQELPREAEGPLVGKSRVVLGKGRCVFSEVRELPGLLVCCRDRALEKEAMELDCPVLP